MTDTQRVILYEYYKRYVVRRRLVDVEPIEPTKTIIDSPKDMTYANWVWFINT